MDGLFDLSGGLVDIWELEIYIYMYIFYMYKCVFICFRYYKCKLM